MALHRFVVEQVILSALRPSDDERYQLDSLEAKRIERAIASVIDGPNAIAELRRVLSLAAALRTQLGSPRAADALEEIVRGNPEAVTLIAVHILKSGAEEETRAFMAREGRAEPLAAPRIDSHADEETVKLAEFLDPASTGRIRQVSRRRGEAHGRDRQRNQDPTDADQRGARRRRAPSGSTVHSTAG